MTSSSVYSNLLFLQHDPPTLRQYIKQPRVPRPTSTVATVSVQCPFAFDSDKQRILTVR